MAVAVLGRPVLVVVCQDNHQPSGNSTPDSLLVYQYSCRCQDLFQSCLTLSSHFQFQSGTHQSRQTVVYSGCLRVPQVHSSCRPVSLHLFGSGKHMHFELVFISLGSPSWSRRIVSLLAIWLASVGMSKDNHTCLVCCGFNYLSVAKLE